MVDLLKLRDQIDRIDREMIRLFEERIHNCSCLKELQGWK